MHKSQIPVASPWRRACVQLLGLVLVLGGLVLPPLPAMAQDGLVRVAVSDPYWIGVYFNNVDLAGAPKLTRTESNIDFGWGNGSPDSVIHNDFFSVRWTRYLYLEEGVYRFTATSDDGMRIWVDDQQILNEWREQGERTFVVDRALSTGHHQVRIEYFEATGTATARFRWERVSSGQPPPAINAWRGDFFNNRDLAGDPALVRNDNDINFAWGWSSPAPGSIQSDNFSVRWTRSLDFPAGNYRFTVTVDDGARLWVNNALIIDEWREQAARTFESDIWLPGGSVPLRLEYFDAAQDATIRLSWRRLDDGGDGGGGGDNGSDDGDDDDAWRARYYNNAPGDPSFDDPVVFERHEDRINNDWGTGSPDSRVNSDWFTARYTRKVWFPEGRTTFTVDVDDGARLYVDGRRVLDKWFAQPRTRYRISINLSRGVHDLRLDYMEETANASIRLTYSTNETNPAPVGNIITCVPPQPQNYAWIKLYRLDGNNRWYSIGRGIGAIEASGFLKIDGLPVDRGRFGDVGEPYKIEQWVDGQVRQSTGDFQNGQPEFRVRAFADNYTPWGCAP